MSAYASAAGAGPARLRAPRAAILGRASRAGASRLARPRAPRGLSCGGDKAGGGSARPQRPDLRVRGRIGLPNMSGAHLPNHTRRPLASGRVIVGSGGRLHERCGNEDAIRASTHFCFLVCYMQLARSIPYNAYGGRPRRKQLGRKQRVASETAGRRKQLLVASAHSFGYS